METLKIYAVEGNPDHLLLVDDHRRVINGGYNLIQRQGKLQIPHTWFQVTYTGHDVSSVIKQGTIDDDATAEKAHRIIRKKGMKTTCKS